LGVVVTIKPAKKLSKKIRIILTLGYLLAIYAFLPFSAQILLSLIKQDLISTIVTTIYIAAGFAALWIMLVIYRIRDIAAYILMSMLALIVVYFMSGLEIQQERIHFIQYAALTMGILWCFEEQRARRNIWIIAILMSSFAGFIDECIQGLVPNRYFDMRDVGLNILASIVGAGFYAILKSYALEQDEVDEEYSGR
jgi:hypothetical protein